MRKRKSTPSPAPKCWKFASLTPSGVACLMENSTSQYVVLAPNASALAAVMAKLAGVEALDPSKCSDAKLVCMKGEK
jgi:hypothetical protein